MDVDVEAEDVDAGGDPRSTMMLEEHQSEPTDEWQLRATPLPPMSSCKRCQAWGEKSPQFRISHSLPYKRAVGRESLAVFLCVCCPHYDMDGLTNPGNYCGQAPRDVCCVLSWRRESGCLVSVSPWTIFFVAPTLQNSGLKKCRILTLETIAVEHSERIQ
jgi:hypothetical protein